MFDFLRVLISFFDKHNIPYMLSGSMAQSIYTGPRYTRDFDFIVHLKPSDVSLVTEFFKDGYYYEENSIKEAVRLKSMFNIIDHKSNYKADFIILKQEEYEQLKFERRKQHTFLETKVYIITAEDLLVSKLAWMQQIYSSLQESDIIELSRLEDFDWNYARHWIRRLKLNTFGLIKND